MKTRLKSLISRTPWVGPLARRIYHALHGADVSGEPFESSVSYWEERYAAGGDSGDGSYGKLARFKADILNAFVADHDIESVIEFGCGDGHQLKLTAYPRYQGFDVSETIVKRCRRVFAADASKSFALMADYATEVADVALSLDVIYHLVEEETFEHYMNVLFGSARKYVIIYSSDVDGGEALGGAHEKHRRFTPWIKQHRVDWKLVERIPNAYPYEERTGQGSLADFYVYAPGPQATPP